MYLIIIHVLKQKWYNITTMLSRLRMVHCCHYETRLVSINNIHVHDVKHGNNIISGSSYFVFVENEQTN